MRKKKSNSEVELKEKKSRANYRCPDKLKDFIFEANRLPPNTVLLNPKEVFDSNKKTYLSKDGKAWLAEDGYLQTLKKTVEDCLDGLPNDFCNFIKEKGFRSAYVYQGREDHQSILYSRILQACDEHNQLCEDLRNYADYFTNWRKHHFISGGTGGAYGADGKLVTMPPARAIYQLTDTKEGTLTEVVPTDLSEALHGVIGERVRTCEICSRIFWANYKNSFTCSTPCLNALRQRRHRKTNKEAINEKRRENYRIKKHLEKNKNGIV